MLSPGISTCSKDSTRNSRRNHGFALERLPFGGSNKCGVCDMMLAVAIYFQFISSWLNLAHFLHVSSGLINVLFWGFVSHLKTYFLVIISPNISPIYPPTYPPIYPQYIPNSWVMFRHWPTWPTPLTAFHRNAVRGHGAISRHQAMSKARSNTRRNDRRPTSYLRGFASNVAWEIIYT